MNKELRKTILTLKTELISARDRVRECYDEEQNYYEGLSESAKLSDKGTDADATAASLSKAVDDIADAIDHIEQALI